MPNQTAVLTRKLFSRIRALVPDGPPPSLEFPPDKWDSEYRAGQWDYMRGLREVPRYAVVGGYVRHFNDRSRILEIGCGAGTLLRYIRDLDFESYHGVDISGAAVEQAAGLSDERVRFTAACGSSFHDGSSYDLVVMNEALYYFDDCISILEHYRSQLRPNGRFIISMVVGAQSIVHWKSIESRYAIEDGVQTTSRSGMTWNCRVIAAGPAWEGKQ